MPKRGEQVELEITDLTPKGDGYANVGGWEFVVRGAVPDDRVQATVSKKRGKTFEATTEGILASKMSRVAAACPHFGICGGCRWQDLSYEDQLQLKQRMVLNALAGFGVKCEDISPILPSSQSFFYRNKMEFSFGLDRDGALQLGLHHRGRYNRVFNVCDCRLQSEISNQIVGSVRKNVIAMALSVYDLRTHDGILRFLVIREGKNTGDVMVNLVVSEYPNDAVEEVAERVMAEIPEITTLIVTLHRGKAQVTLGEREFILKGDGSISETCGGITYDVSTSSFFQTNTGQTELLYNIVGTFASELRCESVLDLYCGTGGISLQLAGHASKVVGVEQTAKAVEDARKNAFRNGITNCTFVADQAENAVEDLIKQGREFDLIVADPPRAGMHKSVLQAITKFRPPVLIYVSCNPQTLAADIQTLGQAGFELKSVQPVDLFPQTPHCEVVTRLEPYPA